MYFYDIYVCFNDEYMSFYEWDSSLVERMLKLEIVRVEDIKVFLEYDLDIEYPDRIILLSDTLNAIAVDIKSNRIVGISSLRLSDEEEICKLASNIGVTDINLALKSHKELKYPFSHENMQKKIFESSILNGSDDYIKYLYNYVFNKKSSNIEFMKQRLLKDIETNFGESYLNLYKIIYK